MKFSIRDLLWLTAIVGIGLVVFAVRGNQQPRWEYKIVYEASYRDLNDLGSEGWELVGVTAMPNNSGAAHFLKRRK
jgi:hypothetical protein